MVPRANSPVCFGSFQTGVKIVLHLVIWGTRFFGTEVAFYLDVCRILIMEELNHFLRLFRAGRWWLDTHELVLRRLLHRERSLAFLARVLCGEHRAFLRGDQLSAVLLLKHAASFGDAHRILFLLHYRGR